MCTCDTVGSRVWHMTYLGMVPGLFLTTIFEGVGVVAWVVSDWGYGW
jgi:hypothetical protein